MEVHLNIKRKIRFAVGMKRSYDKIINGDSVVFA